MSVRQISIFLENKPGHLNTLCRALADANINLLSMALADTQDFGIVRLLVANTEEASQAIANAGFSANKRDVVAAMVPDAPGGLASVLKTVLDAGQNIDYMYPFAGKKDGNSILILRVEDPAKTEEALKQAGIAVLSCNCELA